MTEQTVPMPTSDERLLSAIAYFFGIIGAVFVWILQRDKSRFVRFHAAQALAFDFVVTIFTMVFFSCFFGLMFAGMFGAMLTASNTSSPSESFPLFIIFPTIMPLAIFACIFPFTLLLMIIRIIAAVSVLSGHDFRYPWLGRQVEKFLGDQE